MRFLILFLFAASTVFAQTNKTIPNRAQDGDLILEVNDGGTPTAAMTIDGATAQTSVSSNLTVGGALLMNGSNVSLASNADVSGATTVTFSSSVGTITGLSGGVTGQVIFIYGNDGASTATLENNGAGTQPFLCPGNTNLSIGPRAGAIARYSGTHWIVFGGNS